MLKSLIKNVTWMSGFSYLNIFKTEKQNPTSLDKFVQDLHDVHCKSYLPQEEVQEIENVVPQIIDGAYSDYHNRFCKKLGAFFISHVIKAGSSFDGTKIGPPDSFDFYLVVKELSEDGATSLIPGCKPGFVIPKLRWRTVLDLVANFVFSSRPFERFNEEVLNLYASLIKTPDVMRNFIYTGKYGKLYFKSMILKNRRSYCPVNTSWKTWPFVSTLIFAWEPISSKGYNTSRKEIDYKEFDFLCSSSVEAYGNAKELKNAIIDIEVHLIPCFHVKPEKINHMQYTSQMARPSILKHGGHITFHECKYTLLNSANKRCRLLCYPVTEQELTSKLDINWKTVYKVLKLLFRDFDVAVGLESFLLKTAVHNVSVEKPNPGKHELGQCLLRVLEYLKAHAETSEMSSFLDKGMNIWNIPPSTNYIFKWQLILLIKILKEIKKKSTVTYRFKKFENILHLFKEESITLYVALRRPLITKGEGVSTLQLISHQADLYSNVMGRMYFASNADGILKYASQQMLYRIKNDLNKYKQFMD